MLKSVCTIKGEVIYSLQHSVEPGGKVSDGIVEMRRMAVAGISTYIAAHNLRSDEVDVMEEDAAGEDGGGGGKPGAGRKGKKRKAP